MLSTPIFSDVNHVILLQLCTVFLEGMKDGQHVKFTGEGDQEPGLEAGDIIIVLEEKEHDTFQRHGQDLVTTLDITLVEALCGMTKNSYNTRQT